MGGGGTYDKIIRRMEASQLGRKVCCAKPKGGKLSFLLKGMWGAVKGAAMAKRDDVLDL